MAITILYVIVAISILPNQTEEEEDEEEEDLYAIFSILKHSGGEINRQ